MNIEPPAWLPEEPELLALLHAVLDRFDQQSGDSRSRALLIPAQKHLPSLAAGDAAADRTWALLQELQSRAVLSIREARRSVYDSQWQGAKLAFAPESEDTLRSWLGRAPIERVMQVWQRAVSMYAHAFPGGCDLLLQRRIAINGRTAEEVVQALARIANIQGPATLRQLSAFAFWGDSKVLDERADLIAALFPALDITDRSVVVAVFLPQTVNGVLFIENQDTYTAATRGWPAQLHDLALVYASGFRSSAQRIRQRTGALLHYAGPGVSSLQARIEHWWFDTGAALGPCWFWGDLDFAGMQILKALRERFGEVNAWRPGYESMLVALTAGGGYGASADEAGQRDPATTGCQYADEILLPAIRAHGRIDQERCALSSQLP